MVNSCARYFGSDDSLFLAAEVAPGLTIGCRGCGALHAFERIQVLRAGPAPLTLGASGRWNRPRRGTHGMATGFGAAHTAWRQASVRGAPRPRQELAGAKRRLAECEAKLKSKATRTDESIPC